MPPTWLRTLYLQWAAARGRRVPPAKRPYSCDWQELLDRAGLKRAEDRGIADSELQELSGASSPPAASVVID